MADKRGQPCRSCHSPITGRTYGFYCARCYQHGRDWGDPGQRRIKLAELRKEWLPRVLQVRAWAPNVDWEAIAERWRIIIDRARVKVGERYSSSRELGANRWEKAAAAVLIDIDQGIGGQEVLNLVAAAYIHNDTHPHAYRSEKCMWVVIVRALRKASNRTSAKVGPHRVDLNRTTRAVVIRWLQAAYHSPAAALVELGRRQDDEALGRQARTRDALAELERTAGISKPTYIQS